MATFLTYLIIWCVCGLIGMAIGDLGGKKNGMAGLLLGFLLGPLGILIVALLPAQAMKGEQGARKTTWILAALALVLLLGIVVVNILVRR